MDRVAWLRLTYAPVVMGDYSRYERARLYIDGVDSDLERRLVLGASVALDIASVVCATQALAAVAARSDDVGAYLIGAVAARAAVVGLGGLVRAAERLYSRTVPARTAQEQQAPPTVL